MRFLHPNFDPFNKRLVVMLGELVPQQHFATASGTHIALRAIFTASSFMTLGTRHSFRASRLVRCKTCYQLIHLPQPEWYYAVCRVDTEASKEQAIMAKRQGSSVLKKLAGKKLVFSGKFDYDGEERLKALATAQGASVVKDLDGKVDCLILADLNAGKTIQKKVTSLNAKGAAIEVIDEAAFLERARPTEDQLLALLKEGRRGAKALASMAPRIPKYNHHGALPECPRILGAKLDGLDLSGVEFNGIAFENCSFVGAKLDDTYFIEAVGCDFSKASGDSPRFGKIDGSRFTKANFAKAEFCSHLYGCDFTSANLDGSVVSEHFWGSRVTNQPSGAGPTFENASLRDCEFDAVWVARGNFCQADLTGTAFNACHLEGSIFRKAKMRDTLLVAADLRKTDFSDASLVGSNLAEADLTGATFQGADLTDANLRGAKFDAKMIEKAKGTAGNSAKVGTVGAALKELDAIIKKASNIEVSFQVGNHSDGESYDLRINAHPRYSNWYSPGLGDKISPQHLGSVPFSRAILQAGQVFGHFQVRFETLTIKSTKSPTSGKALRDLMIQGISEAFAQSPPSEDDVAGAAAYRAKKKEVAAAARQQREELKAAAEKEKAKAKKQIAKKIEKEVGKVSDVASFLKALELRIEKPKIDKATKMLKASGFKLFNDITDEHVSGVVKSQTDADLVYACRVEHDGQYSCCTQNLNVCGGLRGSICKHLLVLIIGLVQAGELDPTTIDGWIAKTQNVKPELDKEDMGAIFIKYKGAEAGEVDWRPTETVPEDYYAF